jgi:hypothetical protein
MAYNFLAPVDQKVRDDGYKFVSQDKYLQNPFGATSGISYAGDGSPVSYANSMGGIMSQAPAPLQYIPRDGGGDGRVDPGPTDYGYESSYASTGTTPEENKEFNEDIGVGTIDEADIENNKPGTLGTIGKIGSFLANPFGTIAYSAYQNYAQKKENEKNRQEAQQLQDQLDIADREIAAKGYKEYGTGAADGSGGYNEGDGGSYTGAGEDSDWGGGEKDGGFIDGTNRRPFNIGGRVGYFFGGRVNYKVGGRVSFKNGGLASIL